MARKQPDQFERMVGKMIHGRRMNKFAYKEDVITLLRRQHRAYVRMVKRHLFAVEVMRDHPAKREQCVAILEEMKNYKR